VGDIAEGARMHERWGSFRGLHQVGLDGIVEKRKHRAGGAEIGSRNWTSRARCADHD